MATKTYLELVNKVLVRLRESTVSTINQTAYSSLIAEFVNTVKRDVEDAWQWSALRRTFSINTANGIITYAFDGTDERALVLEGFNFSAGIELRNKTWREVNRVFFSSQTPTEGSPQAYVHNGVNLDGESQVDVYPIPVGVETLKFTVWAPQLDLVLENDEILCPWRPVVEGALARAYAERGEDGGPGSLPQQLTYERVLSDAVALDANKNPEDLIWVAV